ncbi:hypothetical protein CEP52_004976 [Fusarium oligoseptatum]|uniref:ARB-07466-like C-terminal domain-containing protein n=1 Tax=Fusarium oligoseptatum TaxID=2604345 RepID=A0A428U132_9HYPO|nr:hypothetical protein CEP52_004976 [Fusarium oligoseptatum]
MCADGGGSATLSGKEIAEWCMRNRSTLNLKYVIWGQKDLDHICRQDEQELGELADHGGPWRSHPEPLGPRPRFVQWLSLSVYE